METISLILDLDNTLYSWKDAFAPALNITCKYLSKSLRLPIRTVRDSFKRVFLEHQSVEVINAVRELDIWGLDLFAYNEKISVQNAAQDLFLEEFKRLLQLYPNVHTVLKWAKNKGYLLFAFSDARAYWVNFRLKTLGIDEYFDKIYAQEDEILTPASIDYSSNLVQYTEKECKPNTAIINEVISNYNLSIKNVYAIGDSKGKDILPAIKVGANNIWAKYGTKCLPANRRLLSSITPWTFSQRLSGGNVKPQYTIDDFSEIIYIISNMECQMDV
jgi:hypothetical protein